MKRKSLSIIIVFILLASQISLFSSCNTVKEKQKFSEYYFDYFDTVTTITGYTETEEEFKNICEEIKSELNEYHKLYNIYLRYDGINNICVINDVTDGKHNIVKILDYFQDNNISIGSIYSKQPTLNDVFLEITGKELRD